MACLCEISKPQPRDSLGPNKADMPQKFLHIYVIDTEEFQRIKYYLQLYIYTVLAVGWRWGQLNLEQK